MANILGVSAYYHDSAAALIRDGAVVAAAQEERFTRIKHDAAFPENAIAYCLREAGLGQEDISYLTFYERPSMKFERLAETYVAFAPTGPGTLEASMPIWGALKPRPGDCRGHPNSTATAGSKGTPAAKWSRESFVRRCRQTGWAPDPDARQTASRDLTATR